MSYARIEFTFTGNPTLGEIISFKADADTLFEEAAADRDYNTINRYSINTGSETVEFYAQTLFYALQWDYTTQGAYVQEYDVDLSVDGDKVTMQFKEYGHAFSDAVDLSYVNIEIFDEVLVDMPADINFVEKDQITQVSVGIKEPVSTDNLRINLYINLPRIGSVIKKTLLPIEVVENYFVATFGINNVLWGELLNYQANIDDYSTYNVPFFTFPGDPDAPLVSHPELLVDYFIDYSYSYTDTEGNVIEVNKTDNQDNPLFTRNAMIGGISRTFSGYLNSISSSLIDWLNAGDSLKFLSWMPNTYNAENTQSINLKVHQNQPCRLWIINNNTLQGMNVKTQAYWTDGQVSDVQNTFSLDESFGLYELACGPSELRVHNIDISKTVQYYNVWIENDAGDVITEQRRFEIDYEYYERNDILFFKTSLGVYEVVWAHGRREEQRTLVLNENNRPLKTPSLGTGTIIAERSRFNIPYAHNTGYFPKSLRQWLNDFIISNQVIVPTNFFLVPMVLTRKKFDFGQDDEDVFSLDFSIKVAHLESHYSTVPVLDSPFGDFNIDFNEDYFI